jgi:serine/threonine-protein kinase RsbW
VLTGQIDLDLSVDPASVPQARRALECIAVEAGACRGTVEAVRLAVSEACTNVVQHAYRDCIPGRMRIQASVDDRAMSVMVCDDGGGVRPRTDSPGLGLGLGLMAAMADDMQIECNDGANRVSMSFRLDTPPTAFAA